MHDLPATAQRTPLVQEEECSGRASSATAQDLSYSYSYVIPNFNLLNLQSKGKRVFSRLDLVKDYYQVLVNEASQAKTVVVTSFGTFHFNFMPLGLKNVGATFQRLMDQWGILILFFFTWMIF